jgi:hypothetical protein
LVRRLYSASTPEAQGSAILVYKRGFARAVQGWNMSRLIVTLVVLLVVVVGALFFLAGSATEQPTTQVEKAVELGNLAS